MRRIAWLALGLIAAGCGGRVVGVMTVDVGNSIDAAPPQRGSSDASVALDAPRAPVDTGVDVPRVATDVAVAIDAQPDRIIDTGVPPIVDAAPDVVLGRACQVANPNACPGGSYCMSANCISGTCVAAPVSDQQAPVCGCDRVTYWNAGVAASNAAAVRNVGACANGLPCAAAGGMNCANGTFCNLEVASQVACNVGNPAGRCWALPDACPVVVGIGPATRRCNSNAACMSPCDLIMAERVYFVDNTCPQ